jgi:hypothetical protein
MATASVTIHFPWWTQLYLDGIAFCVFMTGYEPCENDAERWSAFISKHVKVIIK